ncbi:hypothetical protein SKAU_G00344300 [Synaphobranchus kaupii]|uniref:Uncharacterized protein n=1 Tax=Synaphobranchus kaupii TaxID=118154 RepID=A0A9Q1IHC3_SYNKA|nr:hypothetical protein SKAU_G00344300 [Synaphobranchus kaupii]
MPQCIGSSGIALQCSRGSRRAATPALPETSSAPGVGGFEGLRSPPATGIRYELYRVRRVSADINPLRRTLNHRGVRPVWSADPPVKEREILKMTSSSARGV